MLKAVSFKGQGKRPLAQSTISRRELGFRDSAVSTRLRWLDSCPQRYAVSEGYRVTAANWRAICPCQRHGAARRRLRRLRASVVALLLTSALAGVGTTFPIEAMNLAVLPERLGMPSGASAQELHLLTTRIRDEFLRAAADEKTLISERIKEQFFQTEVPFGEIIYSEARENGLDPVLVAAIVETESDFRPTLLSPKNAHGLMQLIPSTGALMGAKDLFNPVENVRAGTRYLKYLNVRFNDPQMALAAYNAGEAVVRRYGGIPPYQETQNFVKKVARNHERYQRQVAQRLATAETLRLALSQ